MALTHTPELTNKVVRALVPVELCAQSSPSLPRLQTAPRTGSSSISARSAWMRGGCKHGDTLKNAARRGDDNAFCCPACAAAFVPSGHGAVPKGARMLVCQLQAGPSGSRGRAKADLPPRHGSTKRRAKKKILLLNALQKCKPSSKHSQHSPRHSRSSDNSPDIHPSRGPREGFHGSRHSTGAESWKP